MLIFQEHNHNQVVIIIIICLGNLAILHSFDCI